MTTRETIITAMQTLMYQNGYLNTSLSQLMTFADVGKGQLYHYFNSKKEIGLSATKNLLDLWRKELFQDILESNLTPEEKLIVMFDWFFQFHEKQSQSYYGCPVGNLIVELSTQDEAFRQLLLSFVDDWADKLSLIIQDIKPDMDKDTSLKNANHIISCLQGSIILLKVHQDTTYMAQIIDKLKQDIVSNTLF